MGQGLEQGLRSSLIATRLARAAGLTEDDVSTAHRWRSFNTLAARPTDETAAFLGDEIAFRSDAMTVDWVDQGATFRYRPAVVPGAAGPGAEPAA